MITVGIDPGKVNFAIVALDGAGRVFFARMLRCTIRSMSMHKATQRSRHRAVMRRILRHLRPDQLIIETFVARGFGTQLTEVINVMIGGIMNECDHLNIEEHATMASSWKNDVKRYHDLNALYALGAAHGLPMHPVDALMLATYLRHGKSMGGVDWDAVHANIVRVAALVPLENLVQPKRKRNAVSAPSGDARARPVRASRVLAEPRQKPRRVRGGARGKHGAGADGRAAAAPRDRGGKPRARGARKT